MYFTFDERMTLCMALLTRLDLLTKRIITFNYIDDSALQRESVLEYYGQVKLGLKLDSEFPARTLTFIEPRVWSL